MRDGELYRRLKEMVAVVVVDARFARLCAQGLGKAAVIELAGVMDLFMCLRFFVDLRAVPLDEI